MKATHKKQQVQHYISQKKRVNLYIVSSMLFDTTDTNFVQRVAKAMMCKLVGISHSVFKQSTKRRILHERLLLFRCHFKLVLARLYFAPFHEEGAIVSTVCFWFRILLHYLGVFNLEMRLSKNECK